MASDLSTWTSSLHSGLRVCQTELAEIQVLLKSPNCFDEEWRYILMKRLCSYWCFIQSRILQYTKHISSQYTHSKDTQAAFKQCLSQIESYRWRNLNFTVPITKYEQVKLFEPNAQNITIFPHGIDLVCEENNIFLIGNILNPLLLDLTRACFYLDPPLPSIKEAHMEITQQIKQLARQMHEFRRRLPDPDEERASLVQALFIIMQDFYQIRKAIRLSLKDTHQAHMLRFPLLELVFNHSKSECPPMTTVDDMLEDCQIGYNFVPGEDIIDDKGRKLYEDRLKPSLLEVLRVMQFMRVYCKI